MLKIATAWPQTVNRLQGSEKMENRRSTDTNRWLCMLLRCKLQRFSITISTEPKGSESNATDKVIACYGAVAVARTKSFESSIHYLWTTNQIGSLRPLTGKTSSLLFINLNKTWLSKNKTYGPINICNSNGSIDAFWKIKYLLQATICTFTQLIAFSTIHRHFSNYSISYKYLHEMKAQKKLSTVDQSSVIVCYPIKRDNHEQIKSINVPEIPLTSGTI